MTGKHWSYLSWMVLLLAVAVALLPYITMNYPDPNALAGSPATERAMETIAFLSESPRTVGTENHDGMRVYLTKELESFGFRVQTQETAVDGQPAPLVNIVGRLAGKNTQNKAVLVMAHYDSDYGSPGAFDNASGTAVVLEIARAVAEDPQADNDLIVLFTDGEEMGVLGAPLFLTWHGWAKDVKVALNFDGLSIGPVFLWQSSPQNGWLIKRYAETARPMGVSWIDGIARVLPLDTDFRPFLDAGIMGASFTTPYLPPEGHSTLDQIGLVNPASIRHGIEQGLALTRSLLKRDLSQTEAPDRAYFTLWGNVFVTYPAAVASGLGVLAGLLTIGKLAWELSRKTVKPGEVGSSMLFTASNMLFVLLLQMTIEVLIFYFAPLTAPVVKNSAAVILLILLLGWGTWRLQKRISAAALLLGGQVIWAICAVWSSLASPLFSPLLTLILLVSLIPDALPVLRVGGAAARGARLFTLAVVAFLGAPVVYLLYMITGLIWIPAAIGAVALSLLLALVLPIGRMVVKNS